MTYRSAEHAEEARFSSGPLPGVAGRWLVLGAGLLVVALGLWQLMGPARLHVVCERERPSDPGTCRRWTDRPLGRGSEAVFELRSDPELRVVSRTARGRVVVVGRMPQRRPDTTQLRVEVATPTGWELFFPADTPSQGALLAPLERFLERRSIDSVEVVEEPERAVLLGTLAPSGLASAAVVALLLGFVGRTREVRVTVEGRGRAVEVRRLRRWLPASVRRVDGPVEAIEVEELGQGGWSRLLLVRPDGSRVPLTPALATPAEPLFELAHRAREHFEGG